MTQIRRPNGKFGGKAPEISPSDLYRARLACEEMTMEEENGQPKPKAPMMLHEDLVVFLIALGILAGAAMGWVLRG